MALYEYECTGCNEKFEEFSQFSKRNDFKVCPSCNGVAKRVFSSPRVFVERAGCIEGRPDEFWSRADRHKESNLKKRADAEKEKVRYGDKKAVSKLETAHANLSNQGEHEQAEKVARKLDAK